MKNGFIFLLLLIIGAGTFTPCCQEEVCSEVQSTTPQSPVKKNGACSPFNYCAACNGFITLSQMAEINNLLILKLQHKDALIPVSLSSYADTSWNPPRFEI